VSPNNPHRTHDVSPLLRRSRVWTSVGVRVSIVDGITLRVAGKSGTAISDRVARGGRWDRRQIHIDRLEISIRHAVIGRPRHDLKNRSGRTSLGQRANRIVGFFLAMDVFARAHNLDKLGLGQPLGHTIGFGRQIARHKRTKTLPAREIVRRINIRH